MKTTRADWHFDVQYLPEHDCVETKFTNVVLHDDDDVYAWEREIRPRLAHFNHKVHLLIDLDGLVVKPKAFRTFGEVRAHVLGDHALTSVRYGGDPWTRTSINTSQVLYGAGGEWYASRNEALEALGRLQNDPNTWA